VVPLLSLSQKKCRQACIFSLAQENVSNWDKLVYVFVKRSFIFKIKRSADFENKTSEK
jgi:hypothetical protein